MSNELQHHGIKGQKWGVRRFQNTDGSLTAEGKKRYSSNDYKDMLDKVEKADKLVGTAKERYKMIEKENYQKKLKYDLSQMTDKELQQAVNRLNMEERYKQVMTQRHNLEKGEDKVTKILNISGTVLAGASTALSLAITMKELQKMSK